MLCNFQRLTRTKSVKNRSKMTNYQGRLLLLFFLWHFGYVHGEDNLWCYECNTNLKKERTQECNDPYAGAAVNLVQCSKNESQQCLKSIIFYKSIHTTVRGCVPSNKVKTYCEFKDIYPDANVECLFCSDYACNISTSPSYNFSIILSTISMLLWSTYIRLPMLKNV